MKLGRVIKGYRKSTDQSLDALAGEIGIDPVTLWRIEKNKFSGAKQWPKLLKWLFSEDLNPPNED